MKKKRDLADMEAHRRKMLI